MCSSCGGRAAARLRAGAAPGNPIVLGEANGRTSQPVTFLVDTPKAKRGDHVYVTGSGVDQDVADGVISLGYNPVPAIDSVPRVLPASDSPGFYVRIGRNKWIGFRSRVLADRYAISVGGVVVTRDEVLQIQGE